MYLGCVSPTNQLHDRTDTLVEGEALGSPSPILQMFTYLLSSPGAESAKGLGEQIQLQKGAGYTGKSPI